MNLYRRLARPLIVKTISAVRKATSINTQSRDVARKTTNRNRIRRVAKPLIDTVTKISESLRSVLDIANDEYESGKFTIHRIYERIVSALVRSPDSLRVPWLPASVALPLTTFAADTLLAGNERQSSH